MPTGDYGAAYQRARRDLLGLPCWKCGAPGTTADHIPPISAFRPGEWRGVLRPACKPCQDKEGADISRALATGRRVPLPSRAW